MTTKALLLLLMFCTMLFLGGLLGMQWPWDTDICLNNTYFKLDLELINIFRLAITNTTQGTGWDALAQWEARDTAWVPLSSSAPSSRARPARKLPGSERKVCIYNTQGLGSATHISAAHLQPLAVQQVLLSHGKCISHKTHRILEWLKRAPVLIQFHPPATCRVVNHQTKLFSYSRKKSALPSAKTKHDSVYKPLWNWWGKVKKYIFLRSGLLH